MPEYLHNRPRDFVKTCLKRMLAGFHYAQNDIKKLSSGKFQVKSEESTEWYMVDMGDNNRYPSCDCISFKNTFLPCKHMFAIFTLTSATWESLSSKYRDCPYFNLDEDFLSADALSKCSTLGVESDADDDDFTHTPSVTTEIKKLNSLSIASPDLLKCSSEES